VVAQEIDRARRGGEADFDARMLGREPSKTRDEPPARERRRGAQGERPAPMIGGEGFERLVDLPEGVGDGRQQAGAG